jgi:hypothetical protein
MLFSWYGADYVTDPAFGDLPPEEKANPSMGSWADAGYLAQQQGRLPAHKFRRLHLNLPGLPEGSAFTAEMVMGAIERGVRIRLPGEESSHVAFVDMSGGSSDDAVLAIAHKDPDGFALRDRLVDQGQRPPFDPRKAVTRFVEVLKEYGIKSVTGDKYAGETFVNAFKDEGIAYRVSKLSKHELYEALEPRLNGSNVALLDHSELESQLLSLVWRGNRIDHPGGEHDDFANAAAGAVELAIGKRTKTMEEHALAITKGKTEVIQGTTDRLAVGMDDCQREFWKEITGGR